MDEDIKQIDVNIVIEAFKICKADDVWELYCEKERLFSDRIYWRSVFFEAINKINPICNVSLPKGIEFYNMVAEFAKEIK